jgi:DNA-binding SARP family transcriptional activator
VVQARIASAGARTVQAGKTSVDVLEFRVLGPLEVMRGGRLVEIGGGRKRALLAALLLHANEVVSSDRLIDEVWGERAPATAPKILQGYVSQLRKVLSDEDGGSVLVTKPPGYVLRLEPGQLDVEHFLALLGKGRAALADGEAGEAAMVLREALELWRGPPLTDFAFDSFATEEIARLEELRLSAVEERVDADLALGRQADLVPELETIVARHPLRERPRGQLMLALYRSGRQADALQVYQDGRRTLVEELGLEPGRPLQQLEQAILHQDPSLDLVGPATRPAEAARSGRGVERRAPEVFVGRERELNALLEALHDAVSGRGRLVLIGGEPGIGKSRLVEELAWRAVEADVHWGRCWEAGGAPSYWPWVQAVRSYVRDRNPEQLRIELGSGAAEIAEFVVEIRERLPDVGPPSVLAESELARFRLFGSVADFLKNASRSRPLVLVLEDLNWADDDSLLLLEFVARELGDAHVLVIGTYRDIDLSRRHPLSRTLGELARERLFERALLRGLSHADVGRFIEAACGFAPAEDLVRAVHTQTEGNPFFVSEVVRLLTEEGALTGESRGIPEGWRVRIPEPVREVIGRRLEQLSVPCNETLTVASAIGRDFTLDQLSRLTDQRSQDELLELLEEAIAARVVEELANEPGRYQFTHALIQGTLVDELSLTRRVRLHARIAEMLEKLYASDLEMHAAELAHHFGEAQSVLGPKPLIHYSALAGEAALAARAPEQAVAHFQRALAAKGEQATDEESAALLFGLGRAQIAGSNLARYEVAPAVARLRRAFEYYAEAGAVRRAVTVASHPMPLWLGLGLADFPGLVSDALALVPPEAHEAGGLLAQRCWLAGVIEGDYEAAEAAFHQALWIARKYEDATLERRALANAAFVDAFHLRWDDCLRRGSLAVEMARAAGDLERELPARRAVGWALRAKGEREQARIQTEAALARTEELRERWWLASAGWDDGLLSLYEGDWKRVREMSDLGLAAQPEDPRHLALRAVLEYTLGEFDAGADWIRRLQEVVELVPPPGPIADHVILAAVVPLVRRIANTTEGLDVARAAAVRVLSLPRLAPVLVGVARIGLALIAVQTKDAKAAEDAYASLEPQRGTASFFIPLTIDRLLGLLARTCGDLERALGHFEDGIAFCTRAGYRPELAWAASDYADALDACGSADDRARASELRETARALAAELSMRSLQAHDQAYERPRG